MRGYEAGPERSVGATVIPFSSPVNVYARISTAFPYCERPCSIPLNPVHPHNHYGTSVRSR